ncbi:MAG TPA: hypothetical protein VGL75_16555 [Acidothermaceae bacterium]
MGAVALRVGFGVTFLLLVGCGASGREPAAPALSTAGGPTGGTTASSKVLTTASDSLPAGYAPSSAPPTPAPPSPDLSTETGVLQHFFESDRDWLHRGLGGPNFGGRVYCSVDILGQSSDGRDVYVWTLCEEFYGTKSNVEPGTGVSVPVLLQVNGSGPHTVVTTWRVPGDGAAYAHDIATMFPASVAERIVQGTPDPGAETRLKQRATADLP